MKITVFNGSPRAEQSNTNIIVQSFLEGAQSAGAETDQVFLIKHNINHCTGCFSCWFKTPGKCVYTDDMQELLKKCISSNVTCFATPVYTWNMTAALKNFIDRLIPLRSPVATQSDGNFDMEARISKFPDAIVIANSGFPGDNNFETIKAVFRSCNPVLEIYRNCGHLLKTGKPGFKEKVSEYLDCVRGAGFEIVKDGIVSQSTKDKLKMELASADEYIKMMAI